MQMKRHLTPYKKKQVIDVYMSIGKYNTKERQIARLIYELKKSNNILRTKYLNNDIKIEELKHKLNGKYGNIH